MNSFRIRFSDILRYFILGGIESLLYLIVVDVDNTAFAKILGDGTTSLSAMQIAVVCVGIYLLGFITQSIIQLFYGGDFLGTGIGEVAEFIRFYPTLNPKSYPDWVYWSDRPRRVLDIYRDILETDENAENKTEFLYSNQLFQGTAFAIFLVTTYRYLKTLFDTSHSVWVLITMVLLLASIWLIHWLFGQSRRVVVPVVLGLLVFVAIIFVGRAGSKDCSWLQGLLLAFSYLISSSLAASLARKQIRRVDILAKYNSDKIKTERFRNVLARVGVPKFYILTRTNSARYITDELDSICAQNYPNIKVIVLLDSSMDRDERDQLINTIESYRKDKKLNIQTYESSNTGPAALAYEIRQIYINYAKPDDIAMILDSDDKLYSPSVVSQIVTRMFRTRSNICLVRFEIFGKQNLNYAKNHHNDLVRDLNYDIVKDGREKERKRYFAPDDKRISNSKDISHDEMHRISTIGWTKRYCKEIMEGYHDMVKDFLKKNEETVKDLNDRKYEDFPDIVALLQKKARICAVAKNSVLFRKTGDSVTTRVLRDNYDEQIPYFLAMAKKLADANKNRLIDGGCVIVEKGLLPYKFVQYLNIVYKKTRHGEDYDKNLEETGKQYSCDQFYKKCVKEFFDIDISGGSVSDEKLNKLSAFHDGIVAVVGSDDYDILGDFPEDVKPNSSWETIRMAYGLMEVKSINEH